MSESGQSNIPVTESYPRQPAGSSAASTAVPTITITECIEEGTGEVEVTTVEVSSTKLDNLWSQLRAQIEGADSAVHRSLSRLLDDVKASLSDPQQAQPKFEEMSENFRQVATAFHAMQSLGDPADSTLAAYEETARLAVDMAECLWPSATTASQ